MKRFHIHVSVADLDKSIRFYSTMFGAKPTRVEVDYAKWMLDDPRINFAISTRHQPLGVNHLGFQVDNRDELGDMQAQLLAADARMVGENDQACCYARSDKYWVTDPRAWRGRRSIHSGAYRCTARTRPCSTTALPLRLTRHRAASAPSRANQVRMPEHVVPDE